MTDKLSSFFLNSSTSLIQGILSGYLHFNLSVVCPLID